MRRGIHELGEGVVSDLEIPGQRAASRWRSVGADRRPDRGRGPWSPPSSRVTGGYGRRPCTRGELRALWASDIDLAAGVIRLERGYDMEGEISLKTTARRRRVPVAAVLRDRLIEHKLATAREGISSCSVAPPAMRLTARS